jgi:hypothetical protein
MFSVVIIFLVISFVHSNKFEFRKFDLNKLNITDENNCYLHYNKYVKPHQLKNHQVRYIDDESTTSFFSYLEYWWNTEESEEELYNKVCKYIFNKFHI